MHSQVRVKKVRQVDTICFRGQSHRVAIRVETPWQVVLFHLKTCFILPVHKLVGQHALAVFICDFQYRAAVPLDGNDLYRLVVYKSADAAANGQVFKPRHGSYPSCR